MAHKALGRDLGDLLSRARPARLVGRAAAQAPASAASPAAPETEPSTAQVPLEFPNFNAPPGVTPPSTAASAGQPATTPVIQSSPARPHRPFAPERPPQPAPLGPAPIPAGPFFILVGLDLLLLGAAGVLAFTDVVDRPLSLILAGMAVVAGGACAVFAYLIRPSGPPAPEESKVRVQLRRL